ncbi:MAG: hypothetical protein FJ125_04950 [Deltaproteobacteria bacterium]|nr:hypothetical protein [Deltaproteobacteria bacterium]
MARRPGLKTMPLIQVRCRLEAERRDTWDLYLPLSRLRLEVHDSLAPLAGRFRLRLDADEHRGPLQLSPTAAGQLAAIAGLPASVLEALPASLGLKTVRCMLAMAIEAADDCPRLLRLRGRPGSGKEPRLRAVLPQSFVRIDDRQILGTLAGLPGTETLQASNVQISEDLFALRLVRDDPLNLGSARQPDDVLPGIDVRASETGCHPLEVRNVLFRVVCGNGLTLITARQQALRARNTRLTHERFREAARHALQRLDGAARDGAARLQQARSRYVQDPVQEVACIFWTHRLGNPQGRLGRWVADELRRGSNLFGVDRFQIVQAFTAVARDLDQAQRLRFEDAMGAYLVEGMGRR